MKFILQSNNILTDKSGYATQGWSIFQRLWQYGHPTAHIPNYGHQTGTYDHPVELPNGKILPVRVYSYLQHTDGRKVIQGCIDDWRADALITLYDIWVAAFNFHDYFPKALWIAMFPVDEAPLPNPIGERLPSVDFPVVYSEFACEVLEEARIKRYDYIPHGCETKFWTPGDRNKIREARGLPKDAFIISMIGANVGNPSRKGFPENLMAYKMFLDTHDDALFYLHTNMAPKDDNPAMGLHMHELIEQIGIPSHKIIPVNQWDYASGLPPEYLRDIYRLSDVVTHASRGEGFGLILSDAQACGTPVISTNGSSMPQLTCNGIVTEPLHPWWTGFGGWQVLPDPEAICDAMCQIYDWDTKTRKTNSRKGIKYIKDNFDFDEVIFPKYWAPFLEKVEAELKKRGSPGYMTQQRNWQKIVDRRKKVKVEEGQLAEKTTTEKKK